MPGSVHGIPHALAVVPTSRAYFAHRAALLEPLAIEAALADSFTYTVANGATKWLLSAYDCQLSSTGRLDLRDWHNFMPLSNVTLTGLGSGAYAVTLDPTLPSYSNAEATYYSRLNSLLTMAPHTVGNSGSTMVDLLPGPYGILLVHASYLNFAWLGVSNGKIGNGGPWSEINDTTQVRIGASMWPNLVPLNKAICNQTTWSSGQSGGGNGYSLTYYILPSTWSNISDSFAPYLFRDDFMGSALDTTNVWNRTQSTVGNVEIYTNFQWLKTIGNGSWGANGIYSKTFSVARSAGCHYLCDVYVPLGVTASNCAFQVGLSDGAGYSYTNFAHAVQFTNNGGGVAQIAIYENGTSRGTVGSNWAAGVTYRVRITVGAGNTNATYEIQSTDGTYATFGSGSWTNITPGTTSSSTTPLYAGATCANAQTAYLGDMRVY